MNNNILSLRPKEAKNFFMGQESFSNMDLPPYIVFDKILKDIEAFFGGKELTKQDLYAAKNNETVNHVLYGNKDGKYAWRKYEIINPLIYVSLVNILCDSKNWSFLQKRFKEFQKDKNIESEGIPVVANKRQKLKAAQISHWIEMIEKKSVALSLEYNFLFQTDITDCYGSIYTHSIPWAIHTKEISKNKKNDNNLLGNKIDQHIQAMHYGQTNGIPQGSVLMDFIAEIVLGYVDLELSKMLKKELNKKKFHVLRYRDDYRIFVNDVSDGNIILKCLSEILLNLGFRLNSGKTAFNADVVSGSIKDDKLYTLLLEPVPTKILKEELVRQLLIVQQIGARFPNSGSLIKRLSKILDYVNSSSFRSEQRVVVSLLIDIAYNHPKTVPIVAALISYCIDKLSIDKKIEIIQLIRNKICSLANAGLLEIWVQRMCVNYKTHFNFKEALCKSVYGKNTKIFETNWIQSQPIKKIIGSNIYIDMKKLKKIKAKIDKSEVQIFSSY